MQSHFATTDYSPPVTYTVNETAELLRIDRATVYKFERDGLLRSVRVGKRRRFTLEEIRRFLDEGDP